MPDLTELESLCSWYNDQQYAFSNSPKSRIINAQ